MRYFERKPGGHWERVRARRYYALVAGIRYTPRQFEGWAVAKIE